MNSIRKTLGRKRLLRRNTRPIVAIIGGLAATALAAAAPPAFDSQRSFADLETICAIGPRISGTEGMQRQQELLIDHFTKLGGQCAMQEFDVAHPQTGEPTRLKNLIVSWHPAATERVLLACHYDTRPRPDRELLPRYRDLPFIGANDGASGVALLMELGRQMGSISPRYGVDFVFFDAEELVYVNGRDDYFLGSEHFAKTYKATPPNYKYVAGVVLDMVADKDLKIYYEVGSLHYARAVSTSVWDAAKRAGVKQFIARRKHEVRDDHLPLNEIARIPTCDVIDFDYPHWHTRNDIPASCSAESLGAVGKVMVEWLSRLPDFSSQR